MNAVAQNPVIGKSAPEKRPFRPARFIVGLLLALSGISVVLLVAANIIRLHHLGREITLPIMAVGIIVGIFLLGGGFGIMTTASAGNDESEFDRLLNAGDTLASSEAQRKSEPRLNLVLPNSDMNHSGNRQSGESAT